jgi:hypothetical protein
MDWKHIAYHLGVSETCRATGMSKKNILNCLHNKKRFKSAYGYRWRFVDIDDSATFDIEHSRVVYSKKNTSIEQLTLDGQHVTYYKSMNQAAITMNCSLQNISRAIKRPHQAAMGYRWRKVEQ